MPSNHEPTVKKETLYHGKMIDVEVHDVELPDGKTSRREIVKHPGAVAVIGVNEDGKIPLVRQFRKATEECLLEIPAGKREAEEDAKVTAARELQEETGYTAGHLQEIGRFYTSPGFANELIHLYLATDLRAGRPQTEADEFVSVEAWTLAEVRSALQEGSWRDAKTAFAIQSLLTKYD